MYSQCPRCDARFRVNAAMLRAARGSGRCRKCGHEFDVLAFLTDESPAAGGAAPAVADSWSGDGVELVREEDPPAPDMAPDAPGEVDPASAGGELPHEDYHFSAEDIEKVFVDAREWQKQFGRPTPAPSESPDVADAGVLVDEPRAVEDITLEGARAEIDSGTGESLRLEAEFDYVEEEESDLDDEDSDEIDVDSTSRLRTLEDVPGSVYCDDEDAASPDEDVASSEQGASEDAETAFYRALIEGRELPEAPGPVASAAPSAAPGRSAVPVPAGATVAGAPMHAELRPTPAERWSQARRSRSDDDDLSGLDLARPAPTTRPGHKWFVLGALLLALVLTAQVTHHYRQAIVRHPQAGEVLRRMYALIGQPLSPNWNLDAFVVHQWGPTADVAPGAPLTVRARLTNRADHPQPYPLLRLTFEDRFGAAVARRDFTPAEYLKSDQQATRLIAAAQTTEAELPVVAPGGDAVGYTLDVCLREESRTRCAHGGE